MRLPLMLLGLVLVVAIGGVVMLGPSQSGPAAATVPFTALAEGPRSDVSSRVNYLIETQEELDALVDEAVVCLGLQRFAARLQCRC